MCGIAARAHPVHVLRRGLDELRGRGFVTELCGHERRGATCAYDFGHDRVAALLIAAGDDHRGAFARQLHRDRASQPRRRARYERLVPRQSHEPTLPPA
jgi:hypothetical protein